MAFVFDVEDKGQISDGYHTFNELYYHRMRLFAVICNTYKDKAWKSWLHSDGTMYDNYFIVGVTTDEGDYSYHYHKDEWDMFDVKVLDRAPEWDGHQPSDIGRLSSLVKPIEKTKILVIFDCNNGYSCSCCGRWWTETEAYTLEEGQDPKEFIANLRSRDDDERSVSEAFIVKEQIYS